MHCTLYIRFLYNIKCEVQGQTLKLFSASCNVRVITGVILVFTQNNQRRNKDGVFKTEILVRNTIYRIK